MHPLYISDPEFRALAARVTSIAADLYARLDDLRAYPRTSGAETTAVFDEPVPQKGLHGAALDQLASVVDLSRAPTARFFGYVLGSGEPVAALADMLARSLQQ